MIHLLTLLTTLNSSVPDTRPTPDPVSQIKIHIENGEAYCVGTVSKDHPKGFYLCSPDDAIAQACFIAREDDKLNDADLARCLKVADSVRKEIFYHK